jgi:hypothetical protein
MKCDVLSNSTPNNLPLTASVLAQLPFLLVTSFIFSIIVYGMADISLNSATNFVTSLAAIFLYTLAMVYFGLLVAEVALNAKVSAACFDPSITDSMGRHHQRSRRPEAFSRRPLPSAVHGLWNPCYKCGQTQEGKAEGRILPLIWQRWSHKFWRLYCPAWVSATLPLSPLSMSRDLFWSTQKLTKMMRALM